VVAPTGTNEGTVAGLPLDVLALAARWDGLWGVEGPTETSGVPGWRRPWKDAPC